MKAAVTDGKGKLWIADVEMPKPGEYQCLCRIHACATCTGTDKRHIAGKLPFPVKYPGILGHESVGTVVETGPAARYLSPGDRVLRPAAVYPEEQLGGLYSCWGGFAEYGLVTDTRALLEDHAEAQPNHYTVYQQKLPADFDVSHPDATMLITLKETATYIANVEARLYTSVAILGCGCVGMSMCRFAKIFGAYPVVVVARRDEQLQCAAGVGADFTVNSTREDVVGRIRDLTSGRGVDRVIDTTGDAQFLLHTLAALSTEGKAAPYACYKTSDTIATTILADKLLQVGPSEERAHEYLIGAVRMGLVKLSDFYSHRMPLDRIVEGFDLLAQKKAFKIVFEM